MAFGSHAYGQRLIPNVLDNLAKSRPNGAYASIPKTSNLEDGFRDITYQEIAKATDFLAFWIQSKLGRSSKFETIAYMGTGDLRYMVSFLSAVKCGYKILLPSPRNTAWTNASLMKQTECKALLYAPEIKSQIIPLCNELPDLEYCKIPSLDEMIVADALHYTFEKVYETCKWDPILVLHSSGSTGLPKPIQMNHATFAVVDNDRTLASVPGRKNQNFALFNFSEEGRYFSAFPWFHLAGFTTNLMPIFYENSTLVIGPLDRPPTGDTLSDIMCHFDLKAVVCPPIIMEQFVQSSGNLDKLRSSEFVWYGGGPLSPATGDALSQVTDVCQLYGSTETGQIQAVVPLREDWAYIEFHPVTEAIMEPSIEGAFEMVMARNPKLESRRGISCNFPDVESWRTKDLFKRHSRKPNLWRFIGRVDDIIVLSNGEKFNPVSSEIHVATHGCLSGALIVGLCRPQPALIVEPKEQPVNSESLIQEIWPTVEEANLRAPGHGKITRDKILVAVAEKPFERTAKGTVIRSLTGAKFEPELKVLYESGISRNLQHVAITSTESLQSVSEFVKSAVTSSFSARAFSNHDDLFALGLDSLQTLEIISLLRAGIKAKVPEFDLKWLTMRVLYNNPTIDGLSRAIFDLINPRAHQDGLKHTGNDDHIPIIKAMIDKYTSDLPTFQKSVGSSQKLHVILTGSTGSLGTHTLVRLLHRPEIAKIYCFDRSENARERVAKTLSKWPSPITLDDEKVTFLMVDYGRTDFGLSGDIHSELLSKVDTVVHNAWKVDFNHSLPSFENTHIRGIRNFVNFSSRSSHHPQIIFVSSISSVGGWSKAGDGKDGSGIATIREELQPVAAAQGMGYAESKLVSEHILAAATRRSGISASVLRVGQITGPIGSDAGGKWNDNEWFPSLLKTSKSLGMIPDGVSLVNVDWIPVDTLAKVLEDLVFLESAPETLGSSYTEAKFYHLVHPRVVPWAELLPGVIQHLQRDGSSIRAVPLQEWVAELEKADSNNRHELQSKPALKILDFYRGLHKTTYFGNREIRFSTENSRAASPTMQNLPPVSTAWVNRWIADLDL